MRFTVEAWAPEYGLPSDGALEPADTPVRIDVEVPAPRWAPRRPPDAGSVPQAVLFTDGVRRVDARVWIERDGAGARPGICASYAAGAVRCDGRAQVVAAEVRRALFSAVPEAGPVVTCHGTYPARLATGDDPEQLWLALQVRMGELEVELAASAGHADLVVVDGPLSGHRPVPEAVGYVKTHHVAYLPPALNEVVARLEPGERTPLFLTGSRWSRFSWYLRLPGATGHAWAGVVRCESSIDEGVGAAVALADRVSTVLPRFASTPHKDPRAPQNLHPVAALERELRRRLGDAGLLYRALRAAARGVG